MKGYGPGFRRPWLLFRPETARCGADVATGRPWKLGIVPVLRGMVAPRPRSGYTSVREMALMAFMPVPKRAMDSRWLSSSPYGR